MQLLFRKNYFFEDLKDKTYIPSPCPLQPIVKRREIIPLNSFSFLKANNEFKKYSVPKAVNRK
ncbi:MAG TPA: hypothetical protein VFD45_01245 [Patescibacteria group bacterium]|nr:hypothetical protein [Patescibacteria group bacterium]